MWTSPRVGWSICKIRLYLCRVWAAPCSNNFELLSLSKLIIALALAFYDAFSRKKTKSLWQQTRECGFQNNLPAQAWRSWAKPTRVKLIICPVLQRLYWKWLPSCSHAVLDSNTFYRLKSSQWWGVLESNLLTFARPRGNLIFTF